MARINLGKHVLTSDANNWTIAEPRVVQSGERAGAVVDYPIGYYPTLPSALSALLELRLRDSEATTLRELAAEVAAFRREVREAFAPEVAP